MIVPVTVAAHNADESVNVYYETTVRVRANEQPIDHKFFVEVLARKKFQTFMQRNNPEVFAELITFEVT